MAIVDRSFDSFRVYPNLPRLGLLSTVGVRVVHSEIFSKQTQHLKVAYLVIENREVLPDSTGPLVLDVPAFFRDWRTAARITVGDVLAAQRGNVADIFCF